MAWLVEMLLGEHRKNNKRRVFGQRDYLSSRHRHVELLLPSEVMSSACLTGDLPAELGSPVLPSELPALASRSVMAASFRATSHARSGGYDLDAEGDEDNKVEAAMQGIRREPVTAARSVELCFG